MSSPQVRPKLWRCHITLPGRLAAILPTRWEEFGYKAFSPYAVELVCFDLRRRRPHYVTVRYALETPAAQDAIDCAIKIHFRPGRERDGMLIKAIFQRAEYVACEANALARAETEPGQFVCIRDKVSFPGVLREIIEQRWQELGYPSLSSYITGLIRYDLMLGGPHSYDGTDTHPDLLAALDAATLTKFHSKKKRRILLEYLIEQAAGRHLTEAECEQAIEKLVADLLENALRSQKLARKAGAKPPVA